MSVKIIQIIILFCCLISIVFIICQSNTTVVEIQYQKTINREISGRQQQSFILSEPASEPSTEPASKPASEPSTEQALMPVSEPASKPATESEQCNDVTTEIENIYNSNIIYSPSPYPADSIEEAAWLYARFLRSEIPGYHKDGYIQWLGDFYLQCVDDESLNTYIVKDITDDGIPELFFGRGDEIWTIENSRVVCLVSYTNSWWKLLPIGAMSYYRPGAGHMELYYEAISAESREYPDIALYSYDSDNDGEMDIFYINDDEATKDTWDDISFAYFAMRDAGFEEDENALIFSEWICELENFQLPPKTSIDATLIECDNNYCIVATDFGIITEPDRAYTLIIYDSNEKPVLTIGYGMNYPNISYVSDEMLRISYHYGSGLFYVWFYDTANDILLSE